MEINASFLLNSRVETNNGKTDFYEPNLFIKNQDYTKLLKLLWNDKNKNDSNNKNIITTLRFNTLKDHKAKVKMDCVVQM